MAAPAWEVKSLGVRLGGVLAQRFHFFFQFQLLTFESGKREGMIPWSSQFSSDQRLDLFMLETEFADACFCRHAEPP